MAAREIPRLALNFDDLRMVESIVTAYLAYLRHFMARNSATHRHGQIGVLYDLQTRLRAARLSGNQEVELLLSLDELSALRDAVRGFIMLLRRTIAPSRSRNETIADLEKLCRELQRMLVLQAR